ncbi:hypothetical protein [Paenibacillus sp. PAMC21692]|uniref:hypothetical protein n=1 Tax=Paenibacillus sp. PAMC21692 TaxID=2762320 RepID=UPI00164DBEA1|nr:hypothetical protein [Paenibacillus sp. PAMC21692]QNK60175.1 hypothetical protein H7F31_15700 [Paenibacillus sp. PAMC21692]
MALDRGSWAMLITCGTERSELAVAQWIAAKGARLEASLKLYMNLAATLLISPIFPSLGKSQEAYRKLVQEVEGQTVQPKTNDRDELHNRFEDPAFASIRSELERKLLLWTMEKEDRLPLNTTVKLNYAEVKAKHA